MSSDYSDILTVWNLNIIYIIQSFALPSHIFNTNHHQPSFLLHLSGDCPYQSSWWCIISTCGRYIGSGSILFSQLSQRTKEHKILPKIESFKIRVFESINWIQIGSTTYRWSRDWLGKRRKNSYVFKFLAFLSFWVLDFTVHSF